MSHKISLSESTINIDMETSFSSIDGGFVNQFEQTLEEYYQQEKKIVALNSGTAAIHLALILSGVEEGDEVLCQSFTYVATVSPIIYQKAIPVFIDSENETWNMCPVQLELAIKDRIAKGRKPKAIIFVHSYGMPAKIDEIVAVSRKYKITLIEDAAEALGSEYKGKKCGTFGDFGILSFNNNKIVTTLGGGVLICKTEEEKQKAIFYATQARENVNYYQYKEIGFNYRMNSFAAFIGVSEFKKLADYLKGRLDINSFYKKHLRVFSNITLLKNPSIDFSSNHWLSCISIDEKSTKNTRDKLMDCFIQNNIECRFLWKPMHLQPVFKGYPYYGAEIAENLFNKGLCLPSGVNLSENDLERILSSIKKIL
ncbi:DegT/DnrJ/EryC1/StrS family aminotransferase [Polaribacter butkevichii]|uniref:Pyridoxal phosphate-dependent aminotransferase n=1 Tax=Polaribacter butkevichii TaxID=218490 RepID=A0A2P6CB63_9FLAO|nr:DegT/DnrJ/EryC1/StrS family aminotransferase [Polaribacter butkevichii]PQJ72088.1 pyridoxal phosphate-dependent aminotransferase [Polaribacter butkevichii]